MRKTSRTVCDLTELTEGLAKVFPFGENGGECAVSLIRGKPYVTGSLCPHQNSSLDNAPIIDGEIVCLRHRYRFSPKTGDCLTIGGYGLPIFESVVQGGKVIVTYWEYDD